jgi:hypothetical protein
LYNRTGGVLLAMLIIFLSEFNYEVNNGILYEGFDGDKASVTVLGPNQVTGPAMPLTASGEPAVPQPGQAPAQAAPAQAAPAPAQAAQAAQAAPMPGPTSLTGPGPTSLTGPVAKKDQLAIEAQLKPINTSAPPPT